MLEPLWSDIFCDSTIIKQRGRASQPLNEAKSPWSYHGFIIFYHHSINVRYPLVMTSSFLLKMVIEIVDLPLNMVIFHRFLYVYQRVSKIQPWFRFPATFPEVKMACCLSLGWSPKTCARRQVVFRRSLEGSARIGWLATTIKDIIPKSSLNLWQV